MFVKRVGYFTIIILILILILILIIIIIFKIIIITKLEGYLAGQVSD